MKSRRWAVPSCTLLLASALAFPPNSAWAQSEPAPDPAAGEEAAPEKNWSLEVGADFANHYLFRGVELLNDEGVLVPRAVLSVGNWAFAYYGYAGDITPGRGKYRENDLTADYTFALGNMSLTTGALTYMFNGDAEDQLAFFDTYEVYAIASWDVAGAPTVSYYHDVDQVDGGYLQAGVSHEFALGEQVALSLSGAVGLDFGYNSSGSSGDLNDALIGLDLSWAPTDALSMHALVQRSIALDVLDDIGQDDLTVTTVGLSYTF